jgi:hypothetical protein
MNQINFNLFVDKIIIIINNEIISGQIDLIHIRQDYYKFYLNREVFMSIPSLTSVYFAALKLETTPKEITYKDKQILNCVGAVLDSIKHPEGLGSNDKAAFEYLNKNKSEIQTKLASRTEDVWKRTKPTSTDRRLEAGPLAMAKGGRTPAVAKELKSILEMTERVTDRNRINSMTHAPDRENFLKHMDEEVTKLNHLARTKDEVVGKAYYNLGQLVGKLHDEWRAPSPEAKKLADSTADAILSKYDAIMARQEEGLLRPTREFDVVITKEGKLHAMGEEGGVDNTKPTGSVEIKFTRRDKIPSADPYKTQGAKIRQWAEELYANNSKLTWEARGLDGITDSSLKAKVKLIQDSLNSK